jgi:hypothetical protein
MLNPDQSGFCPQRSTEDQVIRLSQVISDGFQAKKPANRMVLTLLNFSKAYDKVWRADFLDMRLRKGVPVCYVRWIQGYLSNREARVRLNRAYSRTWVMREGVPQGSVLAPLSSMTFRIACPRECILVYLRMTQPSGCTLLVLKILSLFCRKALEKFIGGS